MECTEAQKLSCALFQLAKEASSWWESHSRTIIPKELQALSWKNFKGMIMDQYFLQSYQDLKEFLHLKQGTMIVVDHERRFNQLSGYAPYLVDTEGR